MPNPPLSDALRLNKAYVGIPTFLRAEACKDIDELTSPIAVLGVPFDEGSPFLPGSRFGPRALREHSLRFITGSGGYYDLQTQKRYLDEEVGHKLIADLGDADVWPTDVEQTFANITTMTRNILDTGALIVVLGGDHSITYPVVRAFEQDICVVALDAHSDYSPFVGNLRHTNGHAFRHISEMKNVNKLIQAGVRSIRHTPEMIEDSVAAGNLVLSMGEVRSLGPAALAERVPAGAACYVSIDIDVLDISLVPGCVSGEPNGMSYAELRDILTALAERAIIVGFDLVEVNPPLDVGTGATAYLGAHTIIEFLGRICGQPWWQEKRQRWLEDN